MSLLRKYNLLFLAYFYLRDCARSFGIWHNEAPSRVGCENSCAIINQSWRVTRAIINQSWRVISEECFASFSWREREGEKKSPPCLCNCYSEGKTITCFKWHHWALLWLTTWDPCPGKITLWTKRTLKEATFESFRNMIDDCFKISALALKSLATLWKRDIVKLWKSKTKAVLVIKRKMTELSWSDSKPTLR